MKINQTILHVALLLVFSALVGALYPLIKLYQVWSIDPLLAES